MSTSSQHAPSVCHIGHVQRTKAKSIHESGILNAITEVNELISIGAIATIVAIRVLFSLQFDSRAPSVELCTMYITNAYLYIKECPGFNGAHTCISDI